MDKDEDAIGGTVYSKHWLIQCLLRLIKFVERQPTGEGHQDNGGSDDVNDQNEEEERLEQQLCTLWDMSAENRDVQSVLFDVDADKILCQIISFTTNTRFAEISMGILANMATVAVSGADAYDNRAKDLIVRNRIFCETNVCLIRRFCDVPFLIQLFRFLDSALHLDPEGWLQIVRHENGANFFPELEYLLHSSLHGELLKLLFQYLNNLFYRDPNLGEIWLSQAELPPVENLCIACQVLVSLLDNAAAADNDDELLDTRNKNKIVFRKEDGQFFHQFWFMIETLTDRPNLKLSELATHDLLELFSRFESFIDIECANSIYSYSAACSVWNRLLFSENNPVHIPQEQFASVREQFKSSVDVSLLEQLCRHCDSENVKKDDDDDDETMKIVHGNIGQLYRNVQKLLTSD